LAFILAGSKHLKGMSSCAHCTGTLDLYGIFNLLFLSYWTWLCTCWGSSNGR